MNTDTDDAPEQRVEPTDIEYARYFAVIFLALARACSQQRQELLIDFIVDRDGLNLAYGPPPLTAGRYRDLVYNLMSRLGLLDGVAKFAKPDEEGGGA